MHMQIDDDFVHTILLISHTPPMIFELLSNS
jgi:hypothetical protein